MVRLGLAEFYVQSFVLSVGQACNYKCADCSNFAPYAPKNFLRYDLENIIRDLKIVFNAVYCVGTLQIQGGEPFLYSDLGGLIKFIASSGKVNNIVIATNGSIMPSGELLEIIKLNNVHVRISDYNITPDKTKSLIEILKLKNIAYSLYVFAGGNGYWFNTGRKDFKRTDNDLIVKERFRTCAFRGCLTLERGQFARCSRGNNAPEIQNFASVPGDYLILKKDDKEFRREFMKYYYNLKFMEACRYCSGTNQNDMIIAAEQIKI
ncbi:MAG: radical SAM protein [Synergistaceae bacterium]|nr:radical SAM protein [Synergistaceae bacterium]